MVRCVRTSMMMLKSRSVRICLSMTRLSTCVVVAVFFVFGSFATFDHYKNQLSSVLRHKAVSFIDISERNKPIPSMASKKFQEQKKTKFPKLLVKTSNKFARVQFHPKRYVNKMRTSFRQIERSSNFVKVPSKSDVDTCKNGGHYSQTNRSDDKCIRIHYYNPPAWIERDSLERCYYPCYFTSGGDYQSAPAVLFHMSAVNKSPPLKPSGQIWIFHSLEAPGNSNNNFMHWNTLFNWTYTYRRDSDIMQQVAALHRREIPLDVENYMNSIPLLWQNKSRDIAWFVSRCKVQSSRQMYTKMLSKHVNVDIFGKCGSLKCPSEKWRDCNMMLTKVYKYYLSFENALCTDYVTEKMFNSFVDMTYVLPIIRNRCNLTLYLPPGSYINTNDFKTISDLALFLQSLAENKFSVNKYFTWWKKFYFARAGVSGLCEICKRLHHPEGYHRAYNDISAWVKGSEIYHNMMCKYARDIK